MLNLDDIHSNNIFVCSSCGVAITPFNYSGWEAFVGNGDVTQPICTLCIAMESGGGEIGKEEPKFPLPKEIKA